MRPDLSCDDETLLGDCEVHAHRASGPGGQHRNKTSSAIRLVHTPTGVTANSADSRSQHSNKRLALKRLRMNLALQLRQPPPDSIPPVVGDCLHGVGKHRRLEVGRKDHRFWAVAAFLLDLLDARQGRLGEASDAIGISTGNLTRLLKSDRHLLSAVQSIRRNHGQGPLH
jgi:hypothetical protein